MADRSKSAEVAAQCGVDDERVLQTLQRIDDAVEAEVRWSTSGFSGWAMSISSMPDVCAWKSIVHGKGISCSVENCRIRIWRSSRKRLREREGRETQRDSERMHKEWC